MEELPPRIIHACAGKTMKLLSAARNLQDHPRVCGKNLKGLPPEEIKEGSPPRVREKLKNLLFYIE